MYSRAEDGPVIDLFTLASSLKDEGLEVPLLFRFPDIVNHRLNLLQVIILQAQKSRDELNFRITLLGSMK